MDESAKHTWVVGATREGVVIAWPSLNYTTLEDRLTIHKDMFFFGHGHVAPKRTHITASLTLNQTERDVAATQIRRAYGFRSDRTRTF